MIKRKDMTPERLSHEGLYCFVHLIVAGCSLNLVLAATPNQKAQAFAKTAGFGRVVFSLF